MWLRPAVFGRKQAGRLAPRVGFRLNGVGTPVDGCEVQASIGHVWPDELGNHAAVEVPLTARGRAFFADRAAARDLALFVRGRRVQAFRAEPPAQAIGDIRATFGAALASSRISIVPAGNGLRFRETSPTGKTFFVLVQHVKTHRRGRLVARAKITAQNIKPYSLVF